MSFFLFIYFAIYGGLTIYGLCTLYSAFQGVWPIWATASMIGIVMICLPILLHAVDEKLPYSMIRSLSFLAYIWMALVFWFASFRIGFDIWNAVVWCGSRFRPAAAHYAVASRHAAVATLVLVSAACVWGFVEASMIRLKTVDIQSPSLPPGVPAVRLLQVSDLHIGRTSRTAVVERVVKLAAAANAHALLNTGDFVDDASPRLHGQLQPFSELQFPLGKFAVLGNHEIYPGMAETVPHLQMAGFTLLRQETMELLPYLHLVGIDDPAVGRSPGGSAPDEAAVLAARPNGLVVLLKHRPSVSSAALDTVDLQLSGHSHKGQIFPFGLIVRIFHPHPHSKLLQVSQRTRLYVSNGTGTWGPPFRLLAPPELTLFIIRPQE